jgi:hypothetical protein
MRKGIRCTLLIGACVALAGGCKSSNIRSRSETTAPAATALPVDTPVYTGPPATLPPTGATLDSSGSRPLVPKLEFGNEGARPVTPGYFPPSSSRSVEGSGSR